MSAVEEVLVKVQALLNVEGRTPEEAAAYVAKAHELLAKYDLSIESVGQLKADPRTSLANVDSAIRTVEGKPDGWKGDVLEAVARAFDCRTIQTSEVERTKGGRYRSVKTWNLVGFGHDVEAAGYAVSFLVGEVVRLSKEYSRPMWEDIKTRAARAGVPVHTAESWYVQDEGRHPLKAELWFVKGAAQTVSEALARQLRERRIAQEADANPNALVIQKAEAIEDYLFQLRYGKTRAAWEEEMAARRAAWEALRATETAVEAQDAPKPRPETERARKAREEREERARARRWAKWEREAQRQAARTDWSALEAGQRAGRSIDIRPGVRPGTTAGGGING